METIKNYLDNMFLGLPQTEKTLKAKAEMLTFMEDKYNELKLQGKTENEAIGIVISEFGNLSEVAEELGIDDVFLKNPQDAGEEDSNTVKVNRKTAMDYIADVKKYSKSIALGVFLCICSPIILIVLGGLAEDGKIISETVAGAVGITALFVFVAAAVGIFIITGTKTCKYDYLKKSFIALDKETYDYLAKCKNDTTGAFTVKITIGVIMCIVSVLPLIISACIAEDNEMLCIICLGVMLFIVAIAVFIFVSCGSERDAYNVLLQEEDYTKEKKDNKVMQVIGSIYWPIVVCSYLLYSFITNDWGRSWIIWPVAGIAYGGISAVISACTKTNK